MLTCQRVAMCRHKDEYSHGCGLLACHSNAQKRTIEEELTPPAAFLSCCLSRCIAAVQSCVQVKLQHTSTHAPSSISLPLHCCRTKLRASQTPTQQHSHPQQHFSAAALLPYKVACKSNSNTPALTPPAAFLCRCIAAVQSCVQVKLQHTSTHTPSSISLPLHCCRTKLRASQTVDSQRHSPPPLLLSLLPPLPLLFWSGAAEAAGGLPGVEAGAGAGAAAGSPASTLAVSPSPPCCWAGGVSLLPSSSCVRVSMWWCVLVFVCVCACACEQVCMCMRAIVHSVCKCGCKLECVRAGFYACRCVHACLSGCVCVYVFVHVCA